MRWKWSNFTFKKRKGKDEQNPRSSIMVIKCCGSAFTFFQLLFFSFFCVVYLLYLLFHHVSSGCFTLYDIMHDQFFVYMYCIITKDWDLLHISSAVWKDFKKPGSGREHTVLTNYQKFSYFQSSPISKAATFNDDFPTLCTACPNMFGVWDKLNVIFGSSEVCQRR